MPIRRIQNLYETPKDGLLGYGKIVPKYTEDKQKNGETFKKIGELYFTRMQIREQDYKVAGTSTSRVDLKVRTWFEPFFTDQDYSEKYKIQIEEHLYEIKSLDYDERYLYFYLQEVRL